MGNVAAVVAWHEDWWSPICGSSACSQHHLNENEPRLSIRYAMASTHPHAFLSENSRQNQDMQSDLTVSVIERRASCKGRNVRISRKILHTVGHRKSSALALWLLLVPFEERDIASAIAIATSSTIVC